MQQLKHIIFQDLLNEPRITKLESSSTQMNVFLEFMIPTNI